MYIYMPQRCEVRIIYKRACPRLTRVYTIVYKGRAYTYVQLLGIFVPGRLGVYATDPPPPSPDNNSTFDSYYIIIPCILRICQRLCGSIRYRVRMGSGKSFQVGPSGCRNIYMGIPWQCICAARDGLQRKRI